MHPTLPFYFVICLSILNVLCLRGQTDSLDIDLPVLADTLELTQKTDTSLLVDNMLPDSIAMDSIGINSVLLDSILVDSNIVESEKDSTKHNANKALMWSALFPGGGQFYNKQYIKAPIFPALVGSGIYFTIKNQQEYQSYNEEHLRRLAFPDSIILYPDLGTQTLLKQKLKYKRQRSLSMAVTLTSYGFNLVDAFANAHLLGDKNEHSPAKAAYYSAILPGLGQVYNKRYWKIPVIYGGLAAGGTFIYISFTRMDKFTEAWIFREDLSYVRATFAEGFREDQLLLLRERTLKQLELSIILTSLWYIVNILDATVDGHLHNFDEELKDLTHWSISPQITDLQNGKVAFGYGLTYRF